MDQATDRIHLWETYEVELRAERTYENPYVDVLCWADLEGPGFAKRVYGFWDGGSTFRIRLTATDAGQWRWATRSNTDDPGLNGVSGGYEAVDWSESDKQANPTRRGFLKPTPSGHALQHADGSPFYLLADTCWTAGTWRVPMKGKPVENAFVPGPGIGFEEMIHVRKSQGYNSIAMIAAFPNWIDDGLPANLYDENGVPLRQTWPKGDTKNARSMLDEAGNRCFEAPGKAAGYPKACVDYDRITPRYFQSLDRKMFYMQAQGFIPFFETVRRDHGPSWKAFHDFPESFARYVQYMAARYGTLNLIFSALHLDWLGTDFCLDVAEWREALNAWHETYGPLPFDQPVTALADRSTLRNYGHGEDCPWLSLHGVGNNPRHHGIYQDMLDIFALDDPLPQLNQEPYYPHWFGRKVEGTGLVPTGWKEELDHYYARAMMYGSLMSGGLAGHVYGNAVFGGDHETEGGDDSRRIWKAMTFDSALDMTTFGRFVQSFVNRLDQLAPANDRLIQGKSLAAGKETLIGWSHALISEAGDFAAVYLEIDATAPTLTGLRPNAGYRIAWWDPRAGDWLSRPDDEQRVTDAGGSLTLPTSPDGVGGSDTDWALTLTAV